MKRPIHNNHPISKEDYPCKKNKSILLAVAKWYGILLSFQALVLLHEFCVRHQTLQDSKKKTEAALKRIEVIPSAGRKNWNEFEKSISDQHFRRMFRMTRGCFKALCLRIQTKVGDRKFCSQDYITNVLENGNTRESIMYQAQKVSSGGYVCGEIKLAITLRLLAGGSYLDIATIFDVKYKHVYKIFHYVLKKWICQDNVSRYELRNIINDSKKMYDVSKYFAQGRSGGIMAGVIGALDGWLVRIKCPSLKIDGVRNPGGYYSRKGFYALNVQVVVDKNKKVLFMYVGAKGGEHDSAAFKSSSLYKMLEDMFQNGNGGEMHSNPLGISFYLIGDSAYSLRPFLLVPYDAALPGSPEDTYNYIHSSCRIVVECAFGEIDARWGIFWRPLQFHLKQHRFVIDACMRLHNFILEYKEEQRNDKYDDDLDFFSNSSPAFFSSAY